MRRNFHLAEMDIQELEQEKIEKFDIVLTHLLLSEAKKFSKTLFKKF